MSYQTGSLKSRFLPKKAKAGSFLEGKSPNFLETFVITVSIGIRLTIVKLLVITKKLQGYQILGYFFDLTSVLYFFDLTKIGIWSFGYHDGATVGFWYFLSLTKVFDTFWTYSIRCECNYFTFILFESNQIRCESSYFTFDTFWV